MSSKTMGPLLQVLAHTCTGTGAHRCHICVGTGLTAATSAPGPGSPRPHRHRDWNHPCHIGTGIGLTLATSAPGLQEPDIAALADVALQNLFMVCDPPPRSYDHRIAIIGTCTAIIGTCTAIIGTLIAIIGTCTAIIGTLIAIIGTCTAIIGTLIAIIGTRGPIGYPTGYPRGTIALHGVLYRCNSGSASPTPSARSPSGSPTTPPSSTRPPTARSRSRCYRIPRARVLSCKVLGWYYGVLLKNASA
jgi:hypothetical protein